MLDLIHRSVHELIVVSFAAYKVPTIVLALSGAAARGVDVRLVLETGVDSIRALTFDAKQAFQSLPPQVRYFHWPAALRVEADGSPTNARLHAKGVIADGRSALVTSANLTGHAMELNMELGVLIEGGPTPDRLANHFRELMASGVLVELKG